MALLTLRQAERATGISRTALQKAISRGRLSASKDDLGQWAIDSSELFRVYAPLSEGVGQVSPPGHVVDTAEIEVRHLREKVSMLESERDFLRLELQAGRELLFRLGHQVDVPDKGQDKESPPAMLRWWWIVAALVGLVVVLGGALMWAVGWGRVIVTP